MRILTCTLAALLLSACGSDEAGTPQPEVAEETTPAEAPAETTAEPEAEAETAEGPPPEVERPYEEGVDAQAQIDAAVASSAEDGKRVVLMFGANWCEWCRRLEWVFRNDEAISARLESGFHLVHVDTGTRRSNTNAEVIQRFGDPPSHGLPCLVVLDGEGGIAHTQETGSLESGDRHDPALVLAFLDRWSNAG